MNKMPPWSYSSLTAFETCPKRYYLTRVAKVVSEPETDAILWGNRVHKALENYISKNEPLPDGMHQWEPIVKKVCDSEGNKLVEFKMALTSSFEKTDWNAPDVWCRSIMDIGVMQNNRIVALDWKTGKRKLDSDQLRMSAGILFAHYPDIEIVDTGFVWLREGRIDTQHFERKDIPEIWNTFLPRVKMMEKAFQEDKWDARPSGLCRAWCPVGKVNCGYCGG